MGIRFDETRFCLKLLPGSSCAWRMPRVQMPLTRVFLSELPAISPIWRGA